MLYTSPDAVIERRRARSRFAVVLALIALTLAGVFARTISAAMRPLITAVAHMQGAARADALPRPGREP
jgi:hypothetical protein